MNNEQLPTPHPFMANSAAISYKEMLRVAEVDDIEELFEQIPNEHRHKGTWNFPPSLASEAALYKHMNSILKKSISCEDNLNFLGAGCWPGMTASP